MNLPFIIWISSAENCGRRFGTFCWLDLNRTRSFITSGQSPVSEYIGWANQPRSKFIALYAASRSVATAELFAFEYPQFSVIPHLPAIDKPCHRMWATRSYLRNCQILCTICMHRPYNHFVTMKIMWVLFWSILPTLELLPCCVTTRGGATPMQAKLIKLDLGAAYLCRTLLCTLCMLFHELRGDSWSIHSHLFPFCRLCQARKPRLNIPKCKWSMAHWK